VDFLAPSAQVIDPGREPENPVLLQRLQCGKRSPRLQVLQNYLCLCRYFVHDSSRSFGLPHFPKLAGWISDVFAARAIRVFLPCNLVVSAGNVEKVDFNLGHPRHPSDDRATGNFRQIYPPVLYPRCSFAHFVVFAGIPPVSANYCLLVWYIRMYVIRINRHFFPSFGYRLRSW